MKVLLGCLMCLVLTVSQALAISGGPWSGTTHVVVTGTYAGVLHFDSRIACASCMPGQTETNSIGLFTLLIPKTGLGKGTVVIFESGLTFSGTFQGLADPDTARLTGEIDTTSTVTIGTSSNVETASGNMNRRIKANRNILSVASARIVGKADIQFSFLANMPFDEILYKVMGFKQSEVTS